MLIDEGSGWRNVVAADGAQGISDQALVKSFALRRRMIFLFAKTRRSQLDADFIWRRTILSRLALVQLLGPRVARQSLRNGDRLRRKCQK